jgi:hydroxyacylglutathione hydrolase
MPLTLRTIACLNDNYAYLLHDQQSGATACIDVPEVAPLERALSDEGWSLTEIWVTHHHDDHIQGVVSLQASTGAKVVGAKTDAHRLPQLDVAVSDGDVINFAGNDVQVMDVSGHTIGHIALYVAAANAAFTADSLMTMGCGRLFEGDAPTMWVSLQKLAALPPETLICSGHEYTEANIRFAMSVDGDNPALMKRAKNVAAMRAKGAFTAPSLLSDELKTNPFLRATDADLAVKLGMAGADPADVFAEIRGQKDRF